MAAADEIGYPVVLKLYSETITHKTDVGGVQLNLRDADAVRASLRRRSRPRSPPRPGAQHFQGVTVQPMIKLSDGYELIIGSSLDPQFGPVLLFGTGGQLVEVFKDRALALPPLNTTLARRMMEQTKIFKALKGVRGRKPVDLAALEAAAGPLQPPGGGAALDQGDRHQSAAGLARRLIALDARVVVHGPEVTADQTAASRRSAPIRRSTSPRWTHEGRQRASPSGPIRPEDEPAMVRLPRDALASAASTCATST